MILQAFHTGSSPVVSIEGRNRVFTRMLVFTRFFIVLILVELYRFRYENITRKHKVSHEMQHEIRRPDRSWPPLLSIYKSIHERLNQFPFLGRHSVKHSQNFFLLRIQIKVLFRIEKLGHRDSEGVTNPIHSRKSWLISPAEHIRNRGLRYSRTFRQDIMRPTFFSTQFIYSFQYIAIIHRFTSQFRYILYHHCNLSFI